MFSLLFACRIANRQTSKNVAELRIGKLENVFENVAELRMVRLLNATDLYFVRLLKLKRDRNRNWGC